MSSVQSFIASQAPFGYQVACEVCNSAISCVDFGFPLDKSVYTDSVFIAKKPVTKVLRVYFYEK
jgi:sulfur relay (sulfurtransferase) DsrF/TusC family protein